MKTWSSTKTGSLGRRSRGKRHCTGRQGGLGRSALFSRLRLGADPCRDSLRFFGGLWRHARKGTAAMKLVDLDVMCVRESIAAGAEDFFLTRIRRDVSAADVVTCSVRASLCPTRRFAWIALGVLRVARLVGRARAHGGAVNNAQARCRHSFRTSASMSIMGTWQAADPWQFGARAKQIHLHSQFVQSAERDPPTVRMLLHSRCSCHLRHVHSSAACTSTGVLKSMAVCCGWTWPFWKGGGDGSSCVLA